MVAIIYVVVAYAIALIAVQILKNAKFITKRTETTLDDTILNVMKQPIYAGCILAGILAGLHSLWPALSWQEYDFGDLIFVTVTFWVTYTFNRLIRSIVDWYENGADQKEGGGKSVFGFLETIVSFILFAFVLLFLLNHFGVNVNALFAGLGIAGLAIALALQNTLSGIFSAIYIAIDKPIRQGDFVELDDGTKGFVEDITLRSTRIRTFSNNFVIVPNTKIADMVITNYFLPEEAVGVVVPVGVAYKSDLDKVEKVTIKVAATMMKEYGGPSDFEPLVRYFEFADSSINFNVIMRVSQFADQGVFKHEFIKALKDAYDKEKIEIPFSQIDVHNVK